VRFCGNNTGRDAARYWGETVCITDGTVAGATSQNSGPQVQLFVQGSPELNMPDNIAYQAEPSELGHRRGRQHGDFIDGARNDDIWDCLRDGADDDTLSDGCVRIAIAERPRCRVDRGLLRLDGQHYYVSIQHNSSGFGTILDITGWGSQSNP
jgi:hypothetical protein